MVAFRYESVRLWYTFHPISVSHGSKRSAQQTHLDKKHLHKRWSRLTGKNWMPKKCDRVCSVHSLTFTTLKRPTSAEDYFHTYHEVLQSLADQFAPVRKVRSPFVASILLFGWTLNVANFVASRVCLNDVTSGPSSHLIVKSGLNTSVLDTGPTDRKSSCTGPLK